MNWPCNKCGKGVPDNGMKLFINYRLISVHCFDKKKHRDDYVSDGTCTTQIRLCEQCRKLNDLDLDLENR